MTEEIIKLRRMEAWVMLAHPESTVSQRELAMRFLNKWCLT